MSLKHFSIFAPPALALAALLSAPAAAASLSERIETCGACHGEDGNARMPRVPSLAGQPNFYLMNQLILIREGVRKIPEMEALAKDLKDEEILALAAHYAAAPSKRSSRRWNKASESRG
jgi:cytochrome c553